MFLLVTPYEPGHSFKKKKKTQGHFMNITQSTLEILFQNSEYICTMHTTKYKYKDCLKIASAQDDDAVSLPRGSGYDHNLHQFDTSSIQQLLVIGIHSMAQLMGINPK